MKRMKILLLQDAEWRKKGPHQQHHLMELLSLQGHEIRVIGFDQLWQEEDHSFYSRRLFVSDVCRFYEGAKVSFIRPSFIKIPLLDYISFLLTSRSEINEQVSEFDPDVIIGFSSILTNYWGLKVAKKMKIPYLYYCYDNPSSLLVPKPFVSTAEHIVIKIMKNSDYILTINKALNDYVISLGTDPDITKVLPQGVDMGRFNCDETQRKEIRSMYNVDENDVLLFFMGWLYTFSGLREIIVDINKIRNTHPHIKIMIVGFGEDENYLKDLVESLDIADRVIMTGKKSYDEIPNLISAADICLLSAHNDEVIRDIVPIKLYEYMAMHKPIIATKLPGVYKEFGENNGIIFVDNPEDVVETVLSLDDNIIRKTTMEGTNYIKDYDWDDIVINFEKILRDLL
ncbi:MAG: glycosyltransferase [Methanobacterium formicicum]